MHPRRAPGGACRQRRVPVQGPHVCGSPISFDVEPDAAAFTGTEFLPRAALTGELCALARLVLINTSLSRLAEDEVESPLGNPVIEHPQAAHIVIARL